MMKITEEYLEGLFKEAAASTRLRTNVDLRNSERDGSQRMLNVLLPGTKVDIHRHPMSSESVICLVGRLDEVFYNDDGVEIKRVHLCPSKGKYGCQVPKGVWHTVDIIEPSAIFEFKDGRYGADKSEKLF